MEDFNNIIIIIMVIFNIMAFNINMVNNMDIMNMLINY